MTQGYNDCRHTAPRNHNTYPELPSRGQLALRAATTRAVVNKDAINHSWRKCAVMLPLEESWDEVRSNK